MDMRQIFGFAYAPMNQICWAFAPLRHISGDQSHVTVFAPSRHYLEYAPCGRSGCENWRNTVLSSPPLI